MRQTIFEQFIGGTLESLGQFGANVHANATYMKAEVQTVSGLVITAVRSLLASPSAQDEIRAIPVD